LSREVNSNPVSNLQTKVSGTDDHRAEETEMTIRLMSVDSHPIIHLGLESLFKQQEDFELVSQCSEGRKAPELARVHQPDVVVLDLDMPGVDGLVVVKEMLAGNRPPRMVIYVAMLEEEQMLEAIRAGVHGIVLKEMAPQLLVQCIRKVYAGEKWIERRSARLTLENMLRREAGARSIATLITKRESAILRMVVNGSRNKDIANTLFISEGTVKVHLHNIYEKLGVESRLALLRYAQDKGLF
jgi:DNA-binding NarL/FixJ family response regulator